MAVEILKKGDPEKIRVWDLLHDKRKTYRCNRCGCEWRCEWKDNKFGDRQEFNGDPDILCQNPECGSNAVEEVVVEYLPERM